jgi:hypothetical protein
MLYVIHAYDFTDPKALERRLSARQLHLEGARLLKSKDQFVMGGALLDPEGKMIGSMLVVDFETEEQVQQWLSADPYTTGKVWEKVDIKPFRQADV